VRMTLPCRWSDGGLQDFTGRVRFRRRFGYPGQIDAYERVWLTLGGVSDRAEVRLNDAVLGICAGEGPFEFDVTPLLHPRNELVVDVIGTADRGGLWGETALEVRCTAYLREIRVRAEAAALHVSGLVVGEAERPLDLYVLAPGAATAYTTVTAAPEGTLFHIIAERPPPGSLVQVDLVNGAVVWYTAMQEIGGQPGRPPAVE
jgi:hypothetical protein